VSFRQACVIREASDCYGFRKEEPDGNEEFGER